MTYGTIVMFVVAAILLVVGAGLLARLGSSRITERRVYAYRMIGIMCAAAGVLLVAYAIALRSWTIAP